jgi:hypothetical protein
MRAPIAHSRLKRLSRSDLELLVERAIQELDARDGDCDLEAEHDCCAAADDSLEPFPCRQNRNDWQPGTPEDAEPDDEDLGADEDEPNFPRPRAELQPSWRVEA